MSALNYRGVFSNFGDFRNPYYYHEWEVGALGDRRYCYSGQSDRYSRSRYPVHDSGQDFYREQPRGGWESYNYHHESDRVAREVGDRHEYSSYELGNTYADRSRDVYDDRFYRGHPSNSRSRSHYQTVVKRSDRPIRNQQSLSMGLNNLRQVVHSSSHGDIGIGVNNPADEVEEVDSTDYEDDDDVVGHRYLESNRSWLPSLSTVGPGDTTTSSGDQATQAVPSCENQGGYVSAAGSGLFVPKEILEQITSSIYEPISEEVSKEISKRYSFRPEIENFSLRPPKLDEFMQRRAKEKGLLPSVMSMEDVLTVVQHKLLDILPPMVDLITSLSNSGEGETTTTHKEATQAAIMQLGRVFTHVTKLRRQAVLSVVYPKSEHVLSNPSAFALHKARDDLFTDQFLKTILEEASKDITLATRDKLKALVKRPAARKTANNSKQKESSREQSARLGEASSCSRGGGRRRGSGDKGHQINWALGQRVQPARTGRKRGAATSIPDSPARTDE